MIGPHVWRLEVDDDSVLADAADAHGYCSTVRHLIVVDGTLEGTALAEVVVHELLHACLAGAGLEPDDEERAVDLAAGRLLDAWRRNPQLRDFLAWDARS